MDFTHYDLGLLNANETIEITLTGNSANVKLMNSNNFQYYKNSKKHNYYGGHVSKSPFVINTPNYDHWHLVVDLGGFKGNVKSSIRIL